MTSNDAEHKALPDPARALWHLGARGCDLAGRYRQKRWASWRKMNGCDAERIANRQAVLLVGPWLGSGPLPA